MDANFEKEPGLRRLTFSQEHFADYHTFISRIRTDDASDAGGDYHGEGRTPAISQNTRF